MDNQAAYKADLYSICKNLAKEFCFAKKLNSAPRQVSAQRAWAAISSFYVRHKARTRLGKIHLKVERQRKEMIYFLTVNYFSTNFIFKLIPSILQQHFESKIIVINNSPEDEDLIHLVNQYSQIEVICSPSNIGFGSACNLGITHVYQIDPKALIWLINPDAVLKTIAIATILNYFKEDAEIAILGTNIEDSNGNPWFELGRFNPWLGSVTHRAYNHLQIDGFTKIPSRWVSGCSMVLNLSQFDHCPQFDPFYFLYYEDVDLCEKYFRNNYKIVVTSMALVIHSVSSITSQNPSTKLKVEMMSKLYFLDKYGKFSAIWFNIIRYLVIIAIELCFNQKRAFVRWEGLLDFVKWKTKV